ncbi:MAG: ABC transporter permease [Chloroflexota bacterium]
MTPELFLDPRLLHLAVAVAAPFLLAALGELVLERAGILNVGIEGMMAVGAAAGFLATWGSGGNYLLGVGAAALSGALLGLVLGVYSISLRGQQITMGLGLLVFGLGAASLLYRAVAGVQFTQPRVNVLPQLPVPLLADLPLLGYILFTQNALVYAALLLVPAVQALLYATPFGLRLRACGENPRAADTVGVNVTAIRYTAILGGGLLIGLGGAYLPLAITGGYTDGMIGGRGWIALMLVIMGRWRPWGIVGGALLFSYVEALQFSLGVVARGVPSQFLLALPYLVGIAVVVWIYRGARAPAALALPYHREGRD